MTALLGSSTKQSVIKGHSVGGNTPAEHYYTSAYYDLTLITTPVNRSSYTKTNMQSFFGRINYSYESRYIFTFSLRTDGSSVLAEVRNGVISRLQPLLGVSQTNSLSEHQVMA